MKKMGLGRGLDALLPETNDTDNLVSMIAVTEIDRNPGQPRLKGAKDGKRTLKRLTNNASCC